MAIRETQNEWRNNCASGYDYARRNARRITINGSGLVHAGNWKFPNSSATVYVREGQIARDFVIKRGYTDSIFARLGGEFHERRGCYDGLLVARYSRGPDVDGRMAREIG